MPSIISIENFSKYFGQEQAVSDLSFEVHQGDIFAFLGSNGSGKTTTLRCLLNIYRADAGELLINGQKYSHLLNSFLGYLPEERGLYTRVQVSDLLYYFAKLHGLSPQEAQKNINSYLQLSELKGHEYKRISQLSSGMQQKVQLGLALIHKPQLLILDEPFKGLDPINRQLFTNIFKEFQAQGITIVYSTHVIDEAQRLANRLVMIHKGVRKAYGSVEEVRKSFGKDIINLQFAGKFPENAKLFHAHVTNNSAEVVPCKGYSPQDILKYFLDQDLKIISYSLDYPSLNEIFIKINTNDRK